MVKKNTGAAREHVADAAERGVLGRLAIVNDLEPTPARRMTSPTPAQGVSVVRRARRGVASPSVGEARIDATRESGAPVANCRQWAGLIRTVSRGGSVARATG